MYYWENGNFVFILDCHYLFKYNLDAQKLSEKYPLPIPFPFGAMKPFFCIDTEDAIIYIICTEFRYGVTFNIKTKQFDYKHNKINDWIWSIFDGCYINAMYIPRPIHEIHFICDNTYYLLNKKELTFRKLSEDIGLERYDHRDLYKPCKYVYKFWKKKYCYLNQKKIL